MPNGNDLTIRDVTVAEGIRFSRVGLVERETRYTFFVGNHGPFQLVYPAGEDTTEKVKTDMQARVDSLRSILGS